MVASTESKYESEYDPSTYAKSIQVAISREIECVVSQHGYTLGQAGMIVGIFTFAPSIGILAAAFGKNQPSKSDVDKLMKGIVKLITDLPDMQTETESKA